MDLPIAASSLLCSLLFSLPQAALAQDPAESRKLIAAVVEDFRQAIINKDTAGFMRLFLREDISWVASYTDGSVQRFDASLTDPKEPRGMKTIAGSPRKFIESIARNKERREETFSNLRIDTDGEVAQVWFDYTMLVGD